MSAFSINLTKKRKEAQRTQKQTAELLNIGLPKYQAWEENRSEPCIKDLIKICELYDSYNLYDFVKLKSKDLL